MRLGRARVGRTLSVIVTVAAMLTAGIPAAAFAGDRYKFGYSTHFGPGYGSHHSYGGHYRYGHRPGFHPGYRGHYRHKGHGATNALLGLGIGLLLFDTINRSQRRYNNLDDYDDYGDNRRYRDRSTIYRRAEPPRYLPPPQPRSRSQRPSREEAFAGMNCLQIREYTTTIIIGGEEKDAYGDACLQPDGSWLQGQPKVVPNFDDD